MSMKQYTLQKLTIELVSVLLASLVAFRICEMLSIKLAYLPIVLVGCYIVLKLLYSLSITTIKICIFGHVSGCQFPFRLCG